MKYKGRLVQLRKKANCFWAKGLAMMQKMAGIVMSEESRHINEQHKKKQTLGPKP
jgi:hypothetical protein